MNNMRGEQGAAHSRVPQFTGTRNACCLRCSSDVLAEVPSLGACQHTARAHSHAVFCLGRAAHYHLLKGPCTCAAWCCCSLMSVNFVLLRPPVLCRAPRGAQDIHTAAVPCNWPV
jgi:hypothetical protein